MTRILMGKVVKQSLHQILVMCVKMMNLMAIHIVITCVDMVVVTMKIMHGTLLSIVQEHVVNAKMVEIPTKIPVVMVEKTMDRTMAKMIIIMKVVTLMEAKVHAKILRQIVRKLTPNPMILEHALDHDKTFMQYIARNLAAFVGNRNLIHQQRQENVKIKETAGGSVDSNMEDAHLLTSRKIAENFAIFVS